MILCNEMRFIRNIFFCRILKDDINVDDGISCKGGPLLLQAIAAQAPNVFSSQPVKTRFESYKEPHGKVL